MLPTIFLLNIEGMLPSKKQSWKVKTLYEHIQTTDGYIPFFIITESHIKPYHFDAEILVENYYPTRADRTVRSRGGVILYMHNDLIIDNKQTYSDEFCSSVVVYNKKKNIIIAGVYRPPNSTEISFENSMSTINNFIGTYDNPEVIMMGDFNFPQYNWKTGTMKTGKPTSENNCANMLVDFMNNNLMTQVVEEPTRSDKSILDLIFTNNHQSVHSVTVEKTELSDHDLVSCKLLNSDFVKIFKPNNHYQPKHPLDDLNLKKANWTNIKEDFVSLKWEEVLGEYDVHGMCKRLVKIIIDICEKHCEKHSNLKKGMKLIPRERRSLYRTKKHINVQINRLKYVKKEASQAKIRKLEEKKRNLEIQITESINQERKLKERKLIEKMKTNPKSFYTFAKSKCKIKCKVGPLRDTNGELQSSPEKMANILQQNYLKVFSNPTQDVPIVTEKRNSSMILEDFQFSENDIIKAIEAIPIASAAGPDKIPAIILRECKIELSIPLYMIWRKSLDTGEIPEEYKEQSIIPIFKKGNKSVPANYRPVSLTSHIIKIFERIVRSKMADFIDNTSILTNEQYGFRCGRSCMSQLLKHLESIFNILESEANADVLYLDFSKAFDKVDHNMLMNKLEGYGIIGKVHMWIKNFLTNRKQTVIVDGEKSNSERVISGVPQGTVLGPTLFILYINDITKVIKHSLIKIFADDSKLIKAINSEEDRELLLEDIHAVMQWSKKNNMELNREKFQLLIHGKQNELMLPYDLGDSVVIEPSNNIKDLGVTFGRDLSWNQHITNITNEAKQAAAWILRVILDRSAETMMMLYKTFVRSKLEYASTLWSPYILQDILAIEAIQRTFTSKIAGLKDLNYHDRLKKLDLYSLQRRRERYIIIQTWKIYKKLIPNDLSMEFYKTARYGDKCRRPIHPSRQRHLSTLHYNSFISTGPALFNVIPKKVKSANTLQTFKNKLNIFLKSIPDTPPTRGYVLINNNLLTEWVQLNPLLLQQKDDNKYNAEEMIASEGGEVAQTYSA